VNSTGIHLITSEYPPQLGGVSDYTRVVASGLAAAGDEVHVWCPPTEDMTNAAKKSDAIVDDNSSGVFVHRELGSFKPADLRRVGKLLDQCSAPRRLLVQWVPHGYGYHSMNMAFCLWLRRRAVSCHDIVEVMVHEPYLTFGGGSWKQSGVAAVHRLMTMVLLDAAERVWMSIPAWEASLRPFALKRSLPFRWLPVASNISVVDDPRGVEAVRARYAPAGEQIVGHFGTYDRNIRELLLKSVPTLLRDCENCTVLLLGHGGESMREALIAKQTQLRGRIHAPGTLSAEALSLHISACDVLLQPYIDGVSSRRTSVMVGLTHGVPISTTSGRLTESIWAESAAVSLAPVEDVTALVKETHALLNDEAKRQRLSVAARTLYQDRFHLKHTIAALRGAAEV
jgi:glycosyltransferase involved in cell wall biosynthesis